MGSKRRSRAKSPKAGLTFEKRAARAIAQKYPQLDVIHDEKLLTEPGIKRQFDVVGRLGDVLTHTFEAREHTRPVDITQVDAFETKNATLVEKPQLAGIISSQGFSDSPLKWLRHYGGSKFVQSLYQLRPAVPEDWDGDLRQIKIESDGRCLQAGTAKIVYHGQDPGAIDVRVTARRLDVFVLDHHGRVIGNMLDMLNREMRAAQSSGDIDSRTILMPKGAYLTFGGQTREVLGIEIAFEEISVPASALVDHSGRFPDTLLDVLTKERLLIEDRLRVLRARRTGLDLSLTFTEPDDVTAVDIEDLAPPAADVPSGVAERTAAVVLHLALRLLQAGADSVDIPPELKALLDAGSAALQRGDYDDAERVYKESLTRGTALAALCNLACIASWRGDHESATKYSFLAAQTFPLQPEGFANLTAALIAQNDLTNARTVLERARVLHGVSVTMRRQEGDLLVREGRFVEASEIFFELSLDREGDASILMNLARCEHKLGHHAAAAWDAYRAVLAAATKERFAELAAYYAEVANDPARVLEIVAKVEAVAGPVGPRLCRTAVNAALSLQDTAAARRWLQTIPAADWEAEEYAVSGQLRAAQGDFAGALDDLQRALAVNTTSGELRMLAADCALRASRPLDALALLTGCENVQCARIRALAHAMLSDDRAVLDAVAGLEAEQATRTVFECMGRCPIGTKAGLRVVGSLGRWFVERQSTDVSILAPQALLLATQACEQRDEKIAGRALELIQRARAGGANSEECDIAELLANAGRGDTPQALAIAKHLDVTRCNADRLGVSAHVAFKSGHAEIASLLADGYFCAASAALVEPARVAAVRLLSGFVLGDELATLERIASLAPLGYDMDGRFARALMAYAREDLPACLMELQQLVSDERVCAEALLLKTQCLAEAGAFAELLALVNECTPKWRYVATWANSRAAGPFNIGLRPMVAVATFEHLSEFASVAAKNRHMHCTPGLDWAGTLLAAFQHCPDAEAVWVTRLRYPREFLQRLFRRMKA